MSLNLKARKQELLFVPLGGTNEIGMNLNLYHYQGKWLMVDLGIGFADDYLPRVEVIIPDTAFLRQIKNDIVGLVLTHAHEDHIGAVPYIWDEIGCPIYATPFTMAVLKRKMLDEGVSVGQLPLKIMEPGKSLQVGPFALDLLHLTHSIPEMQAIAIGTDKGIIMHTGDWKFDADPQVGEVSELKRLEAFGDKGVLALVCDSTNVFVEGVSGSEGSVKEGLIESISACKHRVVVATFASNIARVSSIIQAGVDAGRKVLLLGRSLRRVTLAAQETGYLKGVTFIDEKTAASLPRNEVMILCTGCQGEPRAALSKIAANTHPALRLQSGDTVIFSARVIPGNETKVRWLHNRFAIQQVEVITDKDAHIHVSGHPARGELEQMYQLIRPKIAVPVHGEPQHIHEHARFARAMQVPQVIEPHNGAVICLASTDAAEPAAIVGEVHSGYIAIDGTSMISVNSDVIRLRRRLREDGNVTISVVMDKDGVLLSKPKITGPGSLDSSEDGDIVGEISALVEEVTEAIRRPSEELVADKVRHAVRKFIQRELGKKPVLDVHVHVV